MTEYDWNTLHAKAVNAFNGETPNAALEQDILTHFQKHPAQVDQAIDRVATKYAGGSIRSGWAILRSELTNTQTRAGHTAVDTSERDQALKNTGQWMRTCGPHFPSWNEVHDELFGDRGRLHPWRKDAELVDRIQGDWEATQMPPEIAGMSRAQGAPA